MLIPLKLSEYLLIRPSHSSVYWLVGKIARLLETFLNIFPWKKCFKWPLIEMRYRKFFLLLTGGGWVVCCVFSCDQSALCMVQSVRLDVCLSVTPFSLCSHHRIIMKFSGVITNDKSDVHAKGQGQRSKVKVTELKTQLNRFWTVTPVWIYIWWWNDAHSFMLLRRGALLFFKVIRQISRSHGSNNRRIWPRLGVSGL